MLVSRSSQFKHNRPSQQILCPEVGEAQNVTTNNITQVMSCLSAHHDRVQAINKEYKEQNRVSHLKFSLFNNVLYFALNTVPNKMLYILEFPAKVFFFVNKNTTKIYKFLNFLNQQINSTKSTF